MTNYQMAQDMIAVAADMWSRSGVELSEDAAHARTDINTTITELREELTSEENEALDLWACEQGHHDYIVGEE